MTREHVPVLSAARIAARDSSTARATPCGYRWPSSPARARLGRHRLQPVQVPRIPMALPSDQRRSQRQRQRQVPQHGRHLGRPRLIVQAGPSGQERQRLIGTEHVRRDSGRQVRCRVPGADDQNLRRTVGRDKRRQRLRVGRIVEHQQATVAVGLQQVPHRLARIGDSPPGTVLGQSHGLGHRGQSGLQATGVRGVDPGHQPPAGRQLRPRVRGRQLCRPPALQPGRRVNHRYASTSAVQPREHAGPRLEARRLQRDITDHDLVTRYLGSAGQRSSPARRSRPAGRRQRSVSPPAPGPCRRLPTRQPPP